MSELRFKDTEPRPSQAKSSYEPEVYINSCWCGSGNRFARWDDAKAFVDHLVKVWNPPGFIKRTIIKKVDVPANSSWDRHTKLSTRFADSNKADIRSPDGKAA
ncbi:hypothetical protein [Bradyrhizobium ottawaense]|uniref:hypothetical protein n=1 Tax=Bradyrhizobium ottawaense TaxID=931866 RepID=UPI001BAAF952|nr:hypothetical protein [Bradyrhizobium ottawaense]MBR1290146.1 hypothetical protein [Bradyrhizobium ottawaense]